ncbi:Phage integrase [Mycoavidus cysteinexigens]|uniref:Phage integrase n=1 Tax=Mycoavidus cysteinexigens TaxID=1553431 RepID=A0A2Z6ESZ9_9BURK|nr:hypothetical protein [Mycoavidus cysteinexigens]BBE08500.1 Phage integrase [Mycoavidus cysteinexigens]GAM52797.1 hypothetical protein EBME_1260 [bacterium endosymbiont of Mortierella elongata FMR23-6]GLR01383.1 hypothetical protein GCM10007934_11950 [Mycoavidus cysteinexigens]
MSEQTFYLNGIYRQRDAFRDENIDPLTIEEQKAFLAKLPDQTRNLIQFAFWRGLRTSEPITVDWTDMVFVGISSGTQSQCWRNAVILI